MNVLAVTPGSGNSPRCARRAAALTSTPTRTLTSHESQQILTSSKVGRKTKATNIDADDPCA